jgi:hypothetical protein
MARGVSPLFVLGHEAVQKELALRPEQIEKVNQLIAEARAEWKQQLQALGPDHFGDQNSYGAERPSRFAESRSRLAAVSGNMNEKFRSKLAEVLDGAQQTRLREIAIQAAGTHAFRDADVVRELGLTEAQQTQLAAVQREYAEKFAGLRHQGQGPNGGERFSNMQELRQEELNKSVTILNPDQQAKFATMKGKPFDLAQLHEHGARHDVRNHRETSE